MVSVSGSGETFKELIQFLYHKNMVQIVDYVFLQLKLSNKGSRKRLIAVEDAESYLITGLMTNTEYAIAVQGFTSAGNGPLSQTKKARTKKVPLVTGMLKV